MSSWPELGHVSLLDVSTPHAAWPVRRDPWRQAGGQKQPLGACLVALSTRARSSFSNEPEISSLWSAHLLHPRHLPWAGDKAHLGRIT